MTEIYTVPEIARFPHLVRINGRNNWRLSAILEWLDDLSDC
jgi:hypothetical protein